MDIKLQHLVLYANDIELSRRFYEQLGFQKEQHGSGPVHYSINVSGITMKFYPITIIERKFPFSIKSIPDKNAIIIDPDFRTFELIQEKL